MMIGSSGLNEDDVYTLVQLKRELVKHYASRVTITTVRQLLKVVTLTSSVKFIMQEVRDSARDMKKRCDMDMLIEGVGK